MNPKKNPTGAGTPQAGDEMAHMSASRHNAKSGIPGYWQGRDERKLAETVGEWDEMIAAVAGQLNDAATGLKLDAPITQYPNFEHLEADAQAKLKDGLS